MELRAVAVAATLVGCAHAPPQPPGALPAMGLQRLYRVDEGLYRSAQPDESQFIALVNTYKIATVIKLNNALEGHDELPNGIDLIHHPWLPAGPIDHDEIEETLMDVEAARTAGRVVLAHCEIGRDRTGLLIALWRVRHGSLPQAAFNEWIAYGSQRFPLLEAAFFRETGWRP